jgi:hypothetical protein
MRRQEVPMGRLIAAAGALVFAAAIAPAGAEELPWCAKMDVFTLNCGFANYQDCAAVAEHAGTTCTRNPNYQPPPAPVAHRKPAPAKTSNTQR